VDTPLKGKKRKKAATREEYVPREPQRGPKRRDGEHNGGTERL